MPPSSCGAREAAPVLIISPHAARVLAAVFFFLRLSPACQAAPAARDWSVPGTKPSTLELTPATDDWTVTVRRIGVRSRDGLVDEHRAATIYPVVMSPTGVLFKGFERTYAAGAVGRRWLFWDFPTQFRAPEARARTEAEADFGDHLLDVVLLGTADPGKALPSGTYQVKWVVNGELVDDGDSFKYAFHRSQVDR